MNNAKTLLVLKHIVYCLVLIFAFILQTTPGLFSILGIKPLLVVPIAICIAMFEGEFVGGIYGALAGVLCDTVSAALFGFNGFFICLFCIVSGLLVIFLMRCNLLGCILFTLVSMLVRGSIEFLFAYGMWRYDQVWKLYVFYTLPIVAYTVAVSPLAYVLIRRLHRRFTEAIEH